MYLLCLCIKVWHGIWFVRDELDDENPFNHSIVTFKITSPLFVQITNESVPFHPLIPATGGISFKHSTSMTNAVLAFVQLFIPWENSLCFDKDRKSFPNKIAADL